MSRFYVDYYVPVMACCGMGYSARQLHKSKYNYAVVVKVTKFLESGETLSAVASELNLSRATLRNLNPNHSQALSLRLCFRWSISKYWA
tara:strand:- start:918 stop:1184 length:267 start_codon:yes stop_codon:yes gene_type:complete